MPWLTSIYKTIAMFLNEIDKSSREALTPEELCDLIEFSYQNQIKQLSDKINGFLEENVQITELSDSVSELVHLLFRKLDDEIAHLFKKETLIIFPCIKHRFNGIEKIIPTNCVENTVYRNIQGTHKVILNLVQKIRQVLDNYQADASWSSEWKDCLNEMFTLENKIYNWIHLEQNFLYPKING
jgi:iron-sulfur cluster repair protein YtfE (RIC family)